MDVYVPDVPQPSIRPAQQRDNLGTFATTTTSARRDWETWNALAQVIRDRHPGTGRDWLLAQALPPRPNSDDAQTGGGGRNGRAQYRAAHLGLSAPHRGRVATPDVSGAGMRCDIRVMSDSDELHAAVQFMLRTSDTPGAEEWAIMDYEDFGSYRIEEYVSFTAVSCIAQGIAEHGEAYAAWVSYVGDTSGELLEPERFQEKVLRSVTAPSD